jgi:hypothetical protein
MTSAETTASTFNPSLAEPKGWPLRKWLAPFAVVTALLWVKGTDGGKPFDYRLWFSDTYVRTAKGWRYAFGQASLPLPAAP